MVSAKATSYPPSSQQLDDEVCAIALVQQLGDEVQVRDQGRLQNDGHVGGVEQLDGVLLLLPSPLLATHWQIHPEPLQHAEGVRRSCGHSKAQEQLARN